MLGWKIRRKIQQQLPFYLKKNYRQDIDFFNKELVTEFVEYVKSFVKKKKGIFLKIDPDVIINEENCLGEKVKLNYNPEDVFSVLKGCGFKHLGFTKNFETMQPRYTFRIDMNRPFEEIEKNFSKTWSPYAGL